MDALTPADRHRLLTELHKVGRASNAEMESGEQFRRAFYPVAEHLYVFDPDINLVIGYHGAGKTMLFKAAVERQLQAQVVRRMFGRDLFLNQLSKQSAEWLAGYPMGKDFPDVGTLRRFVPQHSDAQSVADLWLAYLARLLRERLPEMEAMRALFEPSGIEVGQIYNALQARRIQVIKALDDLDTLLEREDRWIFVNYDELDTLGGADWELMTTLIRGLLTFWADYTRRWRRLRAKIFLRSDLFANTHISTANFAKLANNRLELTWSDRDLYAMLIKRIANSSDAWRAYCQDAGIIFERDEQLGWIPRLRNVEDARPFVERVAGAYMGKTIKKGRTFTWILDHLRDGNGQITPRTLVSLWGYAAAQELDAAQADERRLLHPSSLRRALDQVSDDYVRMLQSRDMPWLRGVAQRLSGREVPLTRDEWIAIFERDWQEWRNSNQRPPCQTPSEFVNLLIELGVCRLRPDDRIDVPDLFLHGLAIKRRGGVQRKPLAQRTTERTNL